MDKSPEAFRTISEVADALETPAHVLRFWESRFPQIRPVKRAGGRRYYRPADVALLTGIKRLLHDEGMTIRGVQKILREQGIRHVAGLPEEVSPEEEALEAAMAGRLDSEPALPADVVEDETAAALTAALDAPDAPRVVPFAPLSSAAPPSDEKAEDGAVQDAGEPAQQALDWLATLPPDPAATADAGADDAAQADPPADDAAQADLPADDLFDRADSAKSVDSTERAPVTDTPTYTPAEPQATAAADPPKAADSPGAGDDATATLAARLRALPVGGLAARHEALAAIAARIGALRDRLGGLPPRN